MRIIGSILKWILSILGIVIGGIILLGLIIWGIHELSLTRTDEWDYIRDDTVALVKYKGDTEVLVIPDRMDNRLVVKLWHGAIKSTTLREITLPIALDGLDSHFFLGCPNLMAIHVAEDSICYASVDGLLLSKDGARLHTIPSSLTSCTVPDGVKRIENYHCAFLPNLQQVTLPEGLEYIGGLVFNYCDVLAEANIPASVTEIGEHAFLDCPNLTLTVTAGTAGEAYAIANGIPYRLAE